MPNIATEHYINFQFIYLHIATSGSISTRFYVEKIESEIIEDKIDRSLTRIHKSTVPNVLSLLTGGPIRNILLSAYTTQKAS